MVLVVVMVTMMMFMLGKSGLIGMRVTVVADRDIDIKSVGFRDVMQPTRSVRHRNKTRAPVVLLFEMLTPLLSSQTFSRREVTQWEWTSAR
jgi:hypothetical protein